MELQAVANQASRIRALLDKVESHLRCLEALGEDTEHRHFISLLMSKLSPDLIAHLEEMKGAKTSWTVQLLRTNLHNILNAREIAERQVNVNKHQPNTAPTLIKPSRESRQGPRSTTDALIVSERPPNPAASRTRGPCIFCGRTNHFHSECRTCATLDLRRRKLLEIRACFVCLRPGHTVKQCTVKKQCYFCKQTGDHHQSFCPAQFGTNGSFSSNIGTNKTQGDALQFRKQKHDESQTTLATNQTVLLQATYTSVRSPELTNRALVRALLGSGSNCTYITSSLAKRLNLDLRDPENFSVGTFGSQKRLSVKTSVAELQIQLKDGSFKQLDVNVVDRITSPVARIPVDVDLSTFMDKFQELPLADSLPGDVEKCHIDLLIGSDYYLDFVTGERFEIQPGLYLLASKLGWLITGRIDTDCDLRNETTMIVDTRINSTSDHLKPRNVTHQMDNDLPIKPNMQDLWNLESIGIQDDEKAIEIFNQTITRSEDGRYLVTWPWKESTKELSTNHQLSFGRFKSLAKKFQSNLELFQKYKAIINEQEELEIIEKTSDIGATLLKSWTCHYVPHHPVITPGKATTKVRIVYDASAKLSKSATSLDDCRYRGPVILEDLCGLLLRFRLHRVAIVADIEKAFLQVGLQESDRDVTHFFWFQDDTKAEVDNNVQVYRFCRVPFGVISSPFLLGATMKHHLATEGESTSPETANTVISGLYVDNVVTGVDSTDLANEFYRQAKVIFQQASMNLREWSSNDKSFLQPWKESTKELSTNHQLSFGRFKSLAKKFQSNLELFQKYKAIINEQEELGIIEKTSDIGATLLKSWTCHYVPHHPVITPGKATIKVRIVYDASAKLSKSATSLDDCRYRGPVILEDLCGLLLRFRLHRVAIVADIEKAFLQVGLQESDRDVTHFFWFQDDTKAEVDNNVQVYRFCRVPFGVISSPFLLGATMKHHLATEGESTSPETANTVISGLYVDNVVTGVDSTDLANEFYRQAKVIFQQASMNLREWSSNDKSFLQQIHEADRAEAKKQKVLGIAWDIQEDSLSITGVVIDKAAQATTKRQVLQTTASVFDPLGLVCPVTLKAKLLLRKVCHQGLEWDVSLSANDLVTWRNICQDFSKVTTLKSQRAVGAPRGNPDGTLHYQLVCFCDASMLAYAAAVYLRIETATSVEVNLVFENTRLRPPNQMTIPRLELMAALIGVRCLNFVEKQLKLPLTAKVMWTDSTCVLQWLTSSWQKSVFVENRLREIRKATGLSFRFIKGTENPADKATRGETSIDSLNSSNWFHGLTWLENNEARWPTREREPFGSNVDLEETAAPKPQRLFECGSSKRACGSLALPSQSQLEAPPRLYHSESITKPTLL